MSVNDEMPRKLVMHWTEQKLQGPQWLIEDYLERASVAAMIGQPASGKSFLALDWAACIASGQSWNEHRVSRGGVLYIVGEGVSGFGRRLAALKKDGRLSTKDPFFLVTSGFSPFDAEKNAALLLEASELVHRPSIIIVDTLASVFLGRDENKAQDMGTFLKALTELANSLGAALLIIHHSHRDYERARGSSALLGALDTEIFLKPSGDITTGTVTKNKDGKIPPPFLFAVREMDIGVTDSFGNPASSGVVDYKVATELHEGGSLDDLSKGEKRVVDKLVELGGSSWIEQSRLWEAMKSLGFREPIYSKIIRGLVDKGYAEQSGLTIRRKT